MDVKRVLFLMVIVLAAAILIAGCTSTSSSSSGTQDEAKPTSIITTPIPTPKVYEIEKDGFAIVDYDYSKTRVQDKVYQFTIIGVAKNIGTTPISRAEVTVKFKSASGVAFFSEMDEVYNLQPGESWSFQFTTYASTSVDDYDLSIGRVEF